MITAGQGAGQRAATGCGKKLLLVAKLTQKPGGLAPQQPGLPKTRTYLFIHHLHLIFSMLFDEKKIKIKKNLAKKIF